MNVLLRFPIVALVVICLALFAFKVISFVLNGLVAQSGHQHSESHRRGSGFAGSGLLALIIIGVVILGIYRLRGGELSSLVEAETHQVATRQLATIAELQVARQQAQNAVQTSQTGSRPGAIPADPEPEAKEDAIGVTHEVAAPLLSNEESGSQNPESVSATLTEADETQSDNLLASAIPAEETIEERQERLSELASHIGPWIRSLLEEDVTTAASTDLPPESQAAQAAESADKKIVVFQLTGPMRQTYALIPLTPAVDAAVSPMKPLLTTGGLEAIANSLARLLAKTGSDRVETTTADPVASEIEAAMALAESPITQQPPEWIRKPKPGYIVAKTDPLLLTDDEDKPLVVAVNQALTDHMTVITETLDPVLRRQARFVKLELEDTAAMQCVEEQFKRVEDIQTAEGSTKMKWVYALVKFPAAVDNAAVLKIRHSVQTDRIAGLGAVVVLAWLSVCFGCVGIRLWNNGSYLRRGLAVPVIGLLALPLLIGAAGITAGLKKGNLPRYPWADEPKQISIQIVKSH